MKSNVAVLLILLCLGFANPIDAKKLGVLPELTHPLDLAAEGSHLFVCQRTDVLIYSLPVPELTIRFGQEGEGPGEFKIPHMGKGLSIHATSEYLIVNSDTKVSFFSHHGRLLREVKAPPMIAPLPAGNGFISNTLVRVEGKRFPCLAIGLFDRHFNKLKDLFRSDIEFGMGARIFMPPHGFPYTVAGDRIFLSRGKENIAIDIFDHSGNKTGEIKKELTVLPVTPTYKDAVVDYYQTDPVFKDFWEYTKQYLVIQDSFPAVQHLTVDGDRVYVQSYQNTDEGYTWWIFNRDGGLINTTALPTGQTSPLDIPPFTIHAGTYYYLKENPDTEVWELFRVKI